MTVFMQGMRRSGTTIAYDLFCADGSFDTFYEPLAMARPKIGGGSGVQEVDVFESVRRIRSAFLAQRDAVPLEPLLNHGAPRKPDLELDPDLPPLVREYLEYMLRESRNPVLKFTRMYRKVPVLHRLDPEAKFLHLVRDPRSVTTSYLFGPRHKHRRRFLWKRRFFTQTSKKGHWAAHQLASRLLLQDEFRHLAGCPDHLRVLLVWKYVFRETHRAAMEAFGSRYFLLRHEDLAEDPDGTLERLYEILERPLPGHVVDWARANVRPPRAAFDAGSEAWTRAIRRLALGEELGIAGYPDGGHAVARPGARRTGERSWPVAKQTGR